MISTYKPDWDCPEQCRLFDEYLEGTQESEDRIMTNKRFSYNESEWTAFQYGWNACKQHFGLEIEL